jgi:two-component system, OmpR family, sensor histidine kinase KdpD
VVTGRTVEQVSGMAATTRGTLRVYLGSAPGVGKTYAMLDEGRRRKDRGTDVVVALVETHDRPKTAALLAELEVVPRGYQDYRGATFTEMDLDAVLDRHPQVALVDELAHTNVPGVKNEKRWQDVQELLDAGISVITTVNVQHLESLNDVVEKITGVPQRERVPDEVVRGADQVELVDMTPEALRRRMAHGNIYGPDKVDAALSNYFRVGNLTALRELALLWLADKVDEQLDGYRATHGISQTWETRERVVVSLTGGPEGETLIRRAARIAARATGGDLLAVHVSSTDGLTGADPQALAAQRSLVESLGGTYHQVLGDDVPAALLDFSRAENATQLVLGASRRGPIQAFLTGPGIGATVTRLSGDIDVHMVSHERVGGGRGLPALTGGLTVRRRLLGALLALLLLTGLTVGLSLQRARLNLTSEVLLFLLAVVAVALTGGIWPALGAAVAGSLLLNYYFIAPLHRWSIAEGNNVLALIVFTAVAAMVSRVVDLAARRTTEAARATAEAETMSTLAGSVLRGQSALPALLDQVRRTFSMTSATLLEKGPSNPPGGPVPSDVPVDRRGWHVVANAGEETCRRPEDGDTDVPVAEDLALVLRGRPLPASDRRVLGAFAAQAAAALQQGRLAEAAAAAAPLAAADRTRTALLAAVSHDLRTPLSAAKAAVTSLRSSDIEWTAVEKEELLATAQESLDRLIRLVENLLDVSRLQAGAVSVFVRPVGLDELVPLALDDLGPAGQSVQLQVPAELPAVLADSALLERVIANLAGNAVRYAPPGQPPLITASGLGGWIELRVIDRGPGIPATERERVFAPFQRLGDRDNTTGVGLGLALSRGLVESMGGSLLPEDTPGGGLTMVVALPAAPQPPPSPVMGAPQPISGPAVGEAVHHHGLPPGVAHWLDQLPNGQSSTDGIQ